MKILSIFNKELSNKLIRKNIININKYLRENNINNINLFWNKEVQGIDLIVNKYFQVDLKYGYENNQLFYIKENQSIKINKLSFNDFKTVSKPDLKYINNNVIPLINKYIINHKLYKYSWNVDEINNQINKLASKYFTNLKGKLLIDYSSHIPDEDQFYGISLYSKNKENENNEYINFLFNLKKQECCHTDIKYFNIGLKNSNYILNEELINKINKFINDYNLLINQEKEKMDVNK